MKVGAWLATPICHGVLVLGAADLVHSGRNFLLGALRGLEVRPVPPVVTGAQFLTCHLSCGFAFNGDRQISPASAVPIADVSQVPNRRVATPRKVVAGHVIWQAL